MISSVEHGPRRGGMVCEIAWTLGLLPSVDRTRDHIVPLRALRRSLEGESAMTRLAAPVLFSACVLLVGCTGPIYSYSKAGSDAADFSRDSYACVQEPQMSWGVSESPMAVSASDAKRQAHLYYLCMRARGWTAEPP
jgi:hypothetical protein